MTNEIYHRCLVMYIIKKDDVIRSQKVHNKNIPSQYKEQSKM